MKLTHEQIKNITFGAAYLDTVNEKTVFHRFTKEQEALYETISENFYNKSFATSCIRLEFETDSSYLFIKVQIKPRSSRRFYSHDIFVNETLCGTLSGVFENDKEVANGIVTSKEFTLGKKGTKKHVCVHLPWSCSSDIIEISIDDEATVVPVKKSRKMLCYGDSITQGYDATYASNSYASKLTTALNAETRNKGIGGEIFRPELAKLKDEDFTPDIITVAYGTNDWATEVSRDTFCANIDAFFGSLTQNYSNAKVFAIAPIWRADWQDSHSFGEFLQIKEELSKVSNRYSNITLIDGFNFVPANCELFSDKYLHPNDDGFLYYANSLITELKKHL